MRGLAHVLHTLMLALLACAAQSAQAVQSSPPQQKSNDPASQTDIKKTPSLSDAPAIERECLERMLKDASWPRRVIGLLRLERFGCVASAQQMQRVLEDSSWQVRAFAARSLARRNLPQKEDWFKLESEPRVLRSALRYGYTIDAERLQRGVTALAKSDDLKQKILAAELGAASGDPDLIKLAGECIKQVILRMNRAEAGAFSPRLADLTGQRNLYRPTHWQQWLRKNARALQGDSTSTESEAETSNNLPPHRVSASAIAQLEPEQFVALETYMAKLSQYEVDLAICLDCTASMGREIASAQAGIDDMVLFVSDVIASLRVGLVAYRDRSDDFEVRGWPFSTDVAMLREQLWQLSADGGGDHAEAVYPAIRFALSELMWREMSEKVLIVVGDAPPHVGYGGLCATMVEESRNKSQLTTHTIQVKGKPVKHFPEIAEAGGGRCVSLKDADALIAEITGLTLGDRYQDEFREFFQVYLELCR